MGGFCSKEDAVEPQPLRIQTFNLKKNKVLPVVGVRGIMELKEKNTEYWGDKFVGDINGSDSSI